MIHMHLKRKNVRKKNQHNKLDEDGGPEFGVNGCCTEDRLLVSPINDPLLKPVDIYFIEPTSECMKYTIHKCYEN